MIHLDPDALYFLPLGGTGEIGMNLNLYAHRGRLLMVDCGVMFGREGIGDGFALFPDPAFIAEHRDRLDGLVLTHAHQDHLGAVRDLWPLLRCRVYATPFAAAMLRGPLAEAGLADQVPIRVIEQRARFDIGPFALQRIPLTHSTVEMGALVLRCSAGTVLHTGDFKLDPEPLVGLPGDEQALRDLADEGVAACISDSTNADSEGWTPSEGEVATGLRTALAGFEGRIAVTLFSSNVARVQTLCRIAADLDRQVVLMGRSLERTIAVARSVGYLADLPPPLEPRDFGWLPAKNVLLVCTGSQGERRSGLAKLADDKRSDVYLEPGDAVVFSARKIPGNERSVERLERLFAERGIEVVTADDGAVHCSGHPRRDELRQLYRWVKPQLVVPTHGTPSKLEAHAELARDMGIDGVTIRNGQVLRLCPGAPGVVDEVATGRIRRRED